MKSACGHQPTSVYGSPSLPTYGASWFALESRIMFDGAGVATLSTVTTEPLAQSQAEASLSADDATTSDTPPAAAPTGEPQFNSSDQALFDALAAYDTSAARQEIVFLSPSVRDYQQLLDGISPNAEVHVLDPTRDGIAQMAEILAGRTNIDAIHLIGEGTEAQMHLGSSFLTQESISTTYAEQFQQIGQSLSANADLLIYGCNFGRGEAGQLAIQTLASLTGADVAASTNLTGAAGLGGDWTLEVATGVIESRIAITAEGQARYGEVLDITTGLLGHWTFNTNANDSSGNSYHGTLTNGAAIDTSTSTNIVGAGKVSLDGINDYVDLTAHRSNFTSLTQGTISAWIKTTGTAGIIFSSHDIVDFSSGTVFWVSLTGRLGFIVSENNITSLSVVSTTAVNDGNWHHVAVTNGTSGNKLYIDGVQATVSYIIGNSATDRFFDDVTGEDTLYIGRDQRSAGSFYFSGNIDDVRVYNRALTGTDITELYALSDPVITSLAGDSLAYSEGDGAVVIEQGANATVTDVGSSNFDTGTLTVSFTAGSDSAEDVLSIRNQGTGAGQIGVSGSAITYGGTTIGTFTGGSSGSNLVVTLNSSATPTAVTTLVKNITYQNTDTAAPTTGARTVRYVLTDGDGGTSANYDTTVTVSAVNDAPTATIVPLTYSATEQTSLTLHGTGLSIADVDAGSSTVQATVSVVSGTLTATAGTTGVTVSGSGTSSVTLAGTLTQINNLLAGTLGGTLTYLLNSNTPPANDTLTLTAKDLGNTGTGGPRVASDTATLTLTAVNDVPVNSMPGVQTVAEDTPRVFSMGNGNLISISDVDAGGNPAQVTLTGTNGTITLSGTTGLTFSMGDGTADATMTFTGTIANINTALAGMSFVPSTNFNGAASLQIVTNDQGNTGTGGPLSDTDTVALTVSAVNDAPVNSVPGAQDTLQNVPVVFNSGNGNAISIGDIDAGGGAMQIALAAANGVLTLSDTTGLTFSTGDGTNDGTMTFTGSIVDINAALNGLQFTPDFNYSGSTTVTITTTDQGNSGGGGPQTDVDNVVINVAFVNNAPVLNATKSPVLTAQTEDSGAPVGAVGTLVSQLVDFANPTGEVDNITDVDSGAQLGIAVTAADTTNGTWFYSTNGGATWNALGAVSDSTAQLLAADTNARLYVQPNANWNGTLANAITFRAWDQTSGANGGTADTTTNGGMTAFSTDTDTASLTVTAVNDAPVNLVPGAQSVAEDTPLALSGISVNDVDGNLSTVQLAVGNGAVAVTLQGTAAISAGANGSNTVTLSGSQADLDATLATVVYQGNLNFNGADTLTVTSTDSNSSIDVDTVALTVTAVNDAPVITSNGGGATALVNVAENQAAAATITSANVDGGLPMYSIVGGADAALFTLNATTGALTFNNAPDFEAPVDAGANNVYEVTVQVADSSGGTDIQALTIVVTDVNEGLPPPPTIPPSLVPQPPAPPSGAGPPPAGSSPLPSVIVPAPVSPKPNSEVPFVPVLPGNEPRSTAPLPSEVPSAPHPKGINTPASSIQLMREMRGYVEEGVAPRMYQADKQVPRAFGGETLDQSSAGLSEAFRQSLGTVEEDLRRATDISESNLKFAVGVTNLGGVSLTAGVIAWLLRSGALLASLAATLPAWRHFDPLPVVLTSDRTRRRSTAETVVAADRENKQFRGLKDLLDRKGHNGRSEGEGGEG